MSEKHRIAGQKGGLATLMLHGRDHFVHAGRNGGRPTWRHELELDIAKRKGPGVKRKEESSIPPGSPSSILSSGLFNRMREV